MLSKTMKKSEKVKRHYEMLRTQYDNGMIPGDLYLQELKVIADYLEGIYTELQKQKAKIKGQQ